MFSSRLPWEARPNALTRALAARRRSGGDVLDLTVSNPTDVGFDAPPDLLAALADARAGRYEPSPRGLRAAREAVARVYAARGVDVDPDRVVLCASTSEAYAWLLKLLCDPGDAVLAPRPSYPLLDHVAALEGVRLLDYPLRLDEAAWRVDLDTVERAASGARAVVVVSPHNPTGARLSRAEAARLARLGLPLVVDEVFADYAPRDARFVEAAAGVDDALMFALGGLSKSAALPQVKLGWIVVAGPPDTADRALARLDLVADAYLGVSGPVQVAAPALLAAAPARRDAIRARVERNRARLLDCALASDAGWYALLRAPPERSDEEWALALVERDGVLVHPGYLYDFPTDDLLVVSLLAREEVLDEGMRRLERRLA